MNRYNVIVLADGSDKPLTVEWSWGNSPQDALIEIGLVSAERKIKNGWSDAALGTLNRVATSLDIAAHSVDLRGYHWSPGRADAIKRIRRLAREMSTTARRARRSWR